MAAQATGEDGLPTPEAAAAAAPTFKDLTLDDKLDDVQRIVQYATSAIALQRLVHVRMLADTAQRAGFARTHEELFPLLPALAQDDEFVLRQHFAEQLQGLAKVCVDEGSDEAYGCMLSHVLPQLAVLVADTQPEVRIAAGETLVGVAGWVRGDDLGPRVLTIVLRLAHDDEQEDLRMTAAVLLNELAEVLGVDLCHQFVAPEIISLAEDPVFRVRKAAALNMDAVCRTAGQEAAGNRLLPVFLHLAQDDIWGVRKACAESLMGVSACLDPAVRVSELVPQFERFASDSSQWVQEAAYQHLGPFISTLPPGKVTPALLAQFESMADPPTAGRMTTTQTPYCAFSFPAVAATLGKERWGELQGLFLKLAKSPTARVRKPIAASLHELAGILGPEMADKELVPVFELYLQDVDEVKGGVLAHLSRFLAGLSPGMRESFLPVLDDVEISSSSLNWRFRHVMATQLAELSLLFSPAATFSVVRRLALRLLRDAIHEVRLAAAARLAPLLVRCHEADPAWMVDFVGEIQALGAAPTYGPRLILAHAVTALSSTWEADMFREHMVQAGAALAVDSVRNVRLVVAHWLRGAEQAASSAPSPVQTPEVPDTSEAAPAEAAGSAGEHQEAHHGEGGAGALDRLEQVVVSRPTGWLMKEAPLAAALEALKHDVDEEVRAAAGGGGGKGGGGKDKSPGASDGLPHSGDDEPDGDDAVLG